MCLGIPGRVLDLRDDGGMAMGTVDFGGVRREVCLAYVADEVQPGDYVVVHVGFAISRVDEAEARRTFELLKEMSQLDELEWMGAFAERSLEGTTDRRTGRPADRDGEPPIPRPVDPSIPRP
jgi:hydrogenase expression/formation protein HypC